MFFLLLLATALLFTGRDIRGMQTRGGLYCSPRMGMASRVVWSGAATVRTRVGNQKTTTCLLHGKNTARGPFLAKFGVKKRTSEIQKTYLPPRFQYT